MSELVLMVRGSVRHLCSPRDIPRWEKFGYHRAEEPKDPQIFSNGAEPTKPPRRNSKKGAQSDE